MKKIVLIGNPNVGKSVVFSRLTGQMLLHLTIPALP
ncbi:MAG: GTPase [Candidatus Thermoplasmatota archaeon]|nr:GTPase [Candidatus Thermoplasmatota archaeon]